MQAKNNCLLAMREEDIRYIPAVSSTEMLYFNEPRCEITNINLAKKPNVIMEVVANIPQKKQKSNHSYNTGCACS
jgi:hypothetical protein